MSDARHTLKVNCPLACWILATAVGAAGCGTPEPTDGTDATGSMSQAGTAPGEILYTWLQHAAEGLEVRAIVDAGTDCPTASVDGVEISLTARAQAGTDFPVISCTASLPPLAGAVSIGSTTLPAPAAAPQRILVLGDTGCRIQDGWEENCDGRGTGVPWSFPAEARAAAAEEPDLVVHVGDYVYREAACDTTEQPGCAGSPWGDNWDTWKTDFFAPSGPLLDAAPWIVTRGNHEDCSRNYLGWLRFLDGRALSASELGPDGCPQFSPPYKVALVEVDFLVLNTATDPTTEGLDPSAETRYAAEFAHAAAMITAGHSAWTVTHRPFWALSPEWQGDDQPATLEAVDSTLQASIARMPGGAWPAE